MVFFILGHKGTPIKGVRLCYKKYFICEQSVLKFAKYM